MIDDGPEREWCANESEKPVDTSPEEFTKRYKRSNKSKRLLLLEKTLDHGIGVRIPASQPSSKLFLVSKLRSVSRSIF